VCVDCVCVDCVCVLVLFVEQFVYVKSMFMSFNKNITCYLNINTRGCDRVTRGEMFLKHCMHPIVIPTTFAATEATLDPVQASFVHFDL